MKKTTIFLLLVCVFVIFAFSYSEQAASRDVVTKSKLSADQRDMLDLLSIPDDREIELFDFNTKGSYSSLDVWVEVYKDGELADRPAGLSLSSGQTERHKGRIAVVISRSPDFQWTLTVVDNDFKSSNIGEAANSVAPAVVRTDTLLESPAMIEDGKDIILCSSLFLNANTAYSVISVYDLQEQLELLKEYPFAHLVKCRFTK